jgi:phospholipase C
LVPNFEHIIVIVLENKDYTMVAGSSRMPHLNQLAKENVLLENYFAVTHPSLPNYIAMISGDTQDITKNCNDCFVDQPNLADFIEESGRTWKTYQEDMPSECFLGDSKPYYQKHNPFIYFDSIRLDPVRCADSIVPLTQLDQDLSANQLPNYSFIMPNICNSAHDCSRKIADQWVADMVSKIQSSPALGENYLIVITFDEASDDRHESCCGMDSKAGGKIFTVFISPQAKAGFTDDTPYSHYSLLKTILTAWELPELGNTRLPETNVIIAPWN